MAVLTVVNWPDLPRLSPSNMTLHFSNYMQRVRQSPFFQGGDALNFPIYLCGQQICSQVTFVVMVTKIRLPFGYDWATEPLG